MKLTPKEYQQIYDKTNGCCCICGNNYGKLDIHHIISKSTGGSDHPDNLVLICSNFSKGQCHDKLHHSYQFSKEYRQRSKLFLVENGNCYADRECLKVRENYRKGANEAKRKKERELYQKLKKSRKKAVKKDYSIKKEYKPKPPLKVGLLKVLKKSNG